MILFNLNSMSNARKSTRFDGRISLSPMRQRAPSKSSSKQERDTKGSHGGSNELDDALDYLHEKLRQASRYIEVENK